MISPLAFTVALVTWTDAQHELSAVRKAVFVVEQHVPEALEWDDIDAQCMHALARDVYGCAIGTARLLPDGHLGRMAVLAPWRGQGVGAALLRKLLDAARERGELRVELSAQTHALGFYHRFGFTVASDEYEEAGIPHRRMQLTL